MNHIPKFSMSNLEEQIPAVLVWLDAEGGICKVNPFFEHLTGWTLAEIAGQGGLSRIVPEDARPDLAEATVRLKQGESVQRHTCAILTKEGERRDIEWHNRLLHDQHGERAGILAVGIDVTERLKIKRELLEREVTLRRVERHLSEAQRLARLGSWELDLRTGSLYWSAEIFRIFEVDPERFQASYEGFLATVHPEDRQALDDEYQRSLKERCPYAFTHRLLMADGRIKWVRELGEHHYNEGGQAIFTLGTVQDITEQREAELALRASQEANRTLYEQARLKEQAVDATLNGVAFGDLSERFTFVNRSFLRLWGYKSSEDVLGHSVLDVWEDRDKATIALQNVIERGNSSGDLIARRSDGSTFQVNFSAVMLLNSEGQPVQVMASFVDMTEQQALLEAQRQSLREKETLLREIHHRVKNNLQVVSSLLYFQSKRIQNQEDLLVFQDCRTRLHAMILVHEKLYQSSELSRIDFPEYVRSLMVMLAGSFLSRNKVSVEIASSRLDLPIETALPCGMILCELVTNAFKHAYPPGREGPIIVGIHPRGSEIEMLVEDRGEGLPSGFNTETDGSFGWQLVQNLAEQIGGRVELLEGGKGTRIRVTFLWPPASPR